MKALLVCAAALCCVCTACNSPSARLNAPPHGVPEVTSDLQGMFVYMTDNALLADMSISDSHFYPHRAILNSLGEHRLSRLASLMEAYGGEVRFSTSLEDEELIEQRTQVIVDFLCDAGIDTLADVVELGLPGGRGMDANDVILIKLSEAAYIPGKSGSSGSSQTTSTDPH